MQLTLANILGNNQLSATGGTSPIDFRIVVKTDNGRNRHNPARNNHRVV